MYSPEPFRVEDPALLQAFVERHPLGALVAVTGDEFVANHVPMIWRSRAGTLGVLRGHVAKANPVWKLLASNAPVIVIFQGADHYVSPSLYPTRGKVLPTWNYSVVHVHGRIAFHDSAAEALSNVAALAEQFEKARREPWTVGDAPSDYVTSLLDRIVAFEISISRATGKFKANQQRPEPERGFVARALLEEGVSSSDIAELIRAPQGSAKG